MVIAEDLIVANAFKKYIRPLYMLEFVPCHRRKDRSIVVNGKVFPICARCMMMLIGYVFIIPLLFFSLPISFLAGVLLNVPMLLDGITQAMKKRESNNKLRMITGLLSGLGQSMIIVSVSSLLYQMILTL